MRHRARAFEANVGCESDVAGDALPDEMEGVLRGPDVGAAAGDAIFTSGELDGACLGRRSHIAAAFEHADGILRGERDCQSQQELYNTHETSGRAALAWAGLEAYPTYLCSWQKVQSILTFFAWWHFMQPPIEMSPCF